MPSVFQSDYHTVDKVLIRCDFPGPGVAGVPALIGSGKHLMLYV